MLAATLLVLAANAAPVPDYRQTELTEDDRRNVAIICTTSHFSKASRLACLKDETEKLRRQKQAQVDARAAEALTAKEMAH